MKSTSSIRGFNTKITTKPHKHTRCLVSLAKVNYTNKIFVCKTTSLRLSNII